MATPVRGTGHCPPREHVALRAGSLPGGTINASAVQLPATEIGVMCLLTPPRDESFTDGVEKIRSVPLLG
jgi:hypothetical protein